VLVCGLVAASPTLPEQGASVPETAARQIGVWRPRRSLRSRVLRLLAAGGGPPIQGDPGSASIEKATPGSPEVASRRTIELMALARTGFAPVYSPRKRRRHPAWIRGLVPARSRDVAASTGLGRHVQCKETHGERR